MKITGTFAENVYAVKYDQYKEDELTRHLDLWNDITYLKEFYDKNKRYILNNSYLAVNSIREFIYAVNDNAEMLDDAICEYSENNSLFQLFIVLQEKEDLKEVLSLRKAKQNFLRLYGVRLENIYIITGGAIKITQKMQEHENTEKELDKLKAFKKYLQKKDVFNEETFYELLTSKGND